MPTYRSSCHCGRVAIEVDGTIDRAIACNCSMCGRKGSLLWFVPREAVRFVTPEGEALSYEFNKHVIHHRFCPACGIHPYAIGTDRNGRAMAAINVRCIEDIDLKSVPVTEFDGRAL